MNESKPTLKILLSAYACEPNRGSEPGVGWEWATRMAKHHEVHVLTRSNNRQMIEAELGRDWRPGSPRFIYLDLPAWVLKLKRCGICTVFIYYLLWQMLARWHARRLVKAVDLIHHVTFNSFRFPGMWWFCKKPVVLGPLGGSSLAASQFRRCFGNRWWLERLRTFSLMFWKANLWTLLSFYSSDCILTVDDDLTKRFRDIGLNSREMLETALPFELEADPAEIPADSKRDFLLVGNLEPWKAWQITFEAFAQAQRQGARLKVVGTGRQTAAAMARAETLGIAGSVDFLGKQPRDVVWQLMARARGLVFSSVRDTSGNVVIEAMGLCCPVICFKHQGVEIITDDSCAFRIPPADWDISVSGFATAMLALSADNRLVGSMGSAGRARIMNAFIWNKKIEAMLEIYQRVTGHAEV